MTNQIIENLGIKPPAKSIDPAVPLIVIAFVLCGLAYKAYRWIKERT